MPPRRSSRTRASVEPTAPATKRKRNEPEEIVDDEPEEVKPASRTRRSSSVQPAKPRTSTRSRKSLEEVQEEEEGEEERPPTKKKRPSLEAEGSDGEAEEAPKTRTRNPSSRASAAPAASASRKTRGSSVGVKAENAEASLPRRKTVASAATTKASRSARRVSTIVIDSDNDEPYELDENGVAQEFKPAPKAKRGGKKEKVVYVIDDSDDEPQPGPSRPTRRAKKEMTPVKEEVAQEVETKQEESDDEGRVEQVKQEPSAAKPTVVKEPSPKSQDEDEDQEEAEAEAAAAALDAEREATQSPVEEEHSLLDPPLSSIPRQPSPTAPVPSEPEGPKPRLVIHKMALVNFKSYAGRQVIGPFHKVSSRHISSRTDAN